MAAASTTANYDSAQIINKSKKVVKEGEQLRLLPHNKCDDYDGDGKGL